MMEISVKLKLPDDVGKKALKIGKLTPEAIEEMIANSVADYPDESAFPADLPPGFDPALIGLASPEMFGKAKITGDVMAPIDVEWDACNDDD